MGVENEYFIAAPGNGKVAHSPPALGSMLVSAACTRLPHVSGIGVQNIFLPNGGRFYLDCGRHPEFCTPEVDNPGDCVRYVLAGEAIIRDLVMELRKTVPLASKLIVSRTNVDYQPGVTWGCHENYLHRGNPGALPRHLKPFLVTRIFTCAGGLNPYSPGIEFTLAPRLHVFSKSTRECTICGGDIPHERGIYNPRDRPLCRGGYHRLHVVCGDSVASRKALWLRVATTSIVLAMAEAGLNPGDGLALRRPVAALRAYLTDPHFRTTALLRNGRRLTAIQIQRLFLARAIKHLDHKCMPPWAALACERWSEMLDRVEKGPDAVVGALDWATKRALFLDHIRQRGFDPEHLLHWNCLLDRLRSAKPGAGGRLDPSMLESASWRRNRHEFEPFMRTHGLDWDQLRSFLALRDELCEIDIRLGQIAPKGILDSLEPLLSHAVPGIDRIEKAKISPPQGTRASLRGRHIKRLAGRPGCLADWQFVNDGRGRMLNLDDPWANNASWSEPPPISPVVPIFGYSLEQAYAEYERGNYELAWRALKRGLGRRGLARPVGLGLTYMSWILPRLGRYREAIQALDRFVGRSSNPSDDVVRDYIVASSFQALAPSDPRRNDWLQRGDEIVASSRCLSTRRAEILGHKGNVLARTGSTQEAVRALRDACAVSEVEAIFPRMRARIMAQLADALRIAGDPDEAAHWLDQAEQIHMRGDFPGERAEYVLTYKAKLEDDKDRARALLNEAEQIQTMLSDVVGLVRTLLLAARVKSTRVEATTLMTRIMQLRKKAPDLRTCPRLKKILDHWEDWVSGRPCGDETDFFWFL
jgi:tetratricopeptide (TPR) repeat protein